MYRRSGLLRVHVSLNPLAFIGCSVLAKVFGEHQVDGFESRRYRYLRLLRECRRVASSPPDAMFALLISFGVFHEQFFTTRGEWALPFAFILFLSRIRFMPDGPSMKARRQSSVTKIAPSRRDRLLCAFGITC